MAEPAAAVPIGAVPSDPKSVAEATRAAIEELAADSRVAERLALVPTTVALVISAPGGGAALTLMLDRAPVAVVEGAAVSSPEVRVSISAAQLHSFWTGELALAPAILRGEVGYIGPVRKLLRVVPILRQAAPRYLELATRPGGT